MSDPHLRRRAEARSAIRFLSSEYSRGMAEARPILRAIRVLCERFDVSDPLFPQDAAALRSTDGGTP